MNVKPASASRTVAVGLVELLIAYRLRMFSGGNNLSIEFVTRLLPVLLLVSFFAFSAVAQQTPPPATPSPSVAPQSSGDKTQSDQTRPDQTQDKGAQGQGVQDKNAGTSNDRLFLALPNFLTLEKSGKVPPLTTGQKFKVVARGSFDKIEFPWYGVLAAISQSDNSEPGYGQGWKGYGKRYASAFADGTIENFMTSAILPSLLHQDPRFFQSSEGGFTHRAAYSVSRIFITRTDSGRSQFNYSEVFGSAIAASISTFTYHPRSFTAVRYTSTGMPIYVFHPSDRTLRNTASVWGSQVGYDTFTILVKEFWPDIRRQILHKHQAEAPVSDKPAIVK